MKHLKTFEDKTSTKTDDKINIMNLSDKDKAQTILDNLKRQKTRTLSIRDLALLKSIAKIDHKNESYEEKCTHENTSFKHVRCNVCDDCGEIVEFDV